MSKIDVKTGVTGSHLFKKNGTHQNFKQDGIMIRHLKNKIPSFLSDTKKSIINFFQSRSDQRLEKFFLMKTLMQLLAYSVIDMKFIQQ